MLQLIAECKTSFESALNVARARRTRLLTSWTTLLILLPLAPPYVD